MQDDEPKPEKRYPLSASKMSKTPSWIMLGFLLGAVFVAALPPFRKQPVPESAVFRAVEPPKPRAPREPPQLTTIEAVFASWGKYAVWSDDVTEVALWNDHDKDFSDYYEVRRFGDAYYFRTIPRLTRRIISRGKPIPESPLLFTETEEQYREWQSYGRSERPVERERLTRPGGFAPAPGPAPVDRSVAPVAPAPLPPPEFPSREPGKK
jgi:hypothetical protein